MSQSKLQAARELIEEKKYTEARILLMTIRDDPIAAKWIAQIDARRAPVEVEEVPEEKAGMSGCFQWLWGILFLLAMGWVCYGAVSLFIDMGNQLNTAEARQLEGFAAGTVIGGGIGVSFVLCTGIPLLILFGILYWRNRVAIRDAKRHNQTIQVMRSSR